MYIYIEYYIYIHTHTCMNHFETLSIREALEIFNFISEMRNFELEF